MQPTVGRSVHYQRAGSTIHAVITRVETRPTPGTIKNAHGEGLHSAKLLKAWLASEDAYDVYLAVFVHTPTIGDIQFSPHPVPYGAAPADKHWSWPPRVG